MTMENQKAFQLLDHETNCANSVISLPEGKIFKIGKLLERVNALFRQSTLIQLPENLHKEGFAKLTIFGGPGCWGTQYWNQHGVEAEVLDPESNGWKKGKVRMRVVLEFCPDEPEEIVTNNNSENNSLDNIRKNIT